MSLPHETDLNLAPGDVSGLTSADALAGFLTRLGYQTANRAGLTPEAIGLAGDSAAAVKRLELLSEDPEGFLRVLLVQLRSLTARSRTDLARVLGRTNVDHLLVLASDFEALEFVLLDKRSREAQRPGGLPGIKVVPLVYAVNRRDPDRLALRFLRRLTWTCRDALDQFDKLRSVFTAAAYTEEYFQNRALFADHYLLTRVRDDPAWQENPTEAFLKVRDLLRESPGRLAKQAEKTTRSQLIEPIFQLLGFRTQPRKGAEDDQTVPDYALLSPGGDRLSAAFVYRWDRWLDGPDFNDPDTPDENPGACVVSALEAGEADWSIVTNGRQWRLYSRRAHSRATNFYEVDLAEALISSGDTDPNEAFRYWWLFFRSQAFSAIVGQVSQPVSVGQVSQPATVGRAFQPAIPEDSQVRRPVPQCWLDLLQEGSHDYAKQLGERLKERVFVTIFPHLAQGFLEDRRARLGLRTPPTDEELRDTFEATLTLLYRLLFLLYAESRDLLPIREAPYYEASLKKIKGEIAEKAGIAESEAAPRLRKAYSACETTLYDRLARLFQAMDQGDPGLNVPVYNGGLFLTDEGPSAMGGQTRDRPPWADRPETVRHGRTDQRPETKDQKTSDQRARTGDQRVETNAQRVETDDQSPETTEQRPESRETRIGQFLLHHRIPDRFLALAIDRLARDQDDKTFSLVFIDYKSLEVRHLGSIYEGLLEFKLKIADEDLTTQTEDKREKFIPLSQAKPRRGRAAEIVVRKGEVYLSNDKAERKATGSYYTPDPIVRYIVRNAVGPVLAERLESLRTEFRNVRKTFNRELEKVRAYPVKTPKGEPVDPREFALEKTYAAHKELVEKLFDFRVLDPAMGSGHFLVEAVDFITDRALHFLNQFPVNPVSFMLEKTRRNILQALAQQGVTADPAKLTEVNLPKRHVLKRCIYGVDLNPIAVELAKVSLWLDAFTLGAPLSFLDHHLRCGNSLIGATFQDLEEATKGQLFGIDYEPLLRAINHVLLVNRMSDATAAEARQSASEYDLARRALSGYQIVLDLLVAQHFGYPEAPDLISRGKGLDLTSRERLFGSLLNEKEQRLVEAVERLARQPDRRFFHWETEFPEVFFGFADADHRQIKHKDRLSAGTSGFDAVVGNPPYVRQEAIKTLKAYLKSTYETFDSANDLYVYFQEREVRNLKVGGRMGMIVANKWMRAGYGENVRSYLLRTAQPVEVVDFGHSPIFPDADTFPCILLVARRSVALPDELEAPQGEQMAACMVPREHWNERMDLGAFVEPRRYSVPTILLRDEGWSLEDPRVQALLEKIRNTGIPLKDYCKGGIYRGPVTGLNEAFFLDAATRDRLIEEDKRSAEVIKPLLRGRDIDRWRPRKSEMCLIFARRGIEIDRYPAIKRHLSQFREKLAPRPADWDDHQGKWPGRAPGDYQWYELQASPGEDAVEATFKPKTVFQEMAWFNRFALDSSGAVLGNTAYLFADTRSSIAAVLNSPLAWWYMWRTAQHGKDEVLRLIGSYVTEFPVPPDTTGRLLSAAEPMVADLATLAERLFDHENSVLSGLQEKFGISQIDLRVMAWLGLDEEAFAGRVARLSESKRPTAKALQELGAFQQKARARQIEVLTRQLELERRLAVLVEDAYGLTPGERHLLHATRPIRDPLDVLESKIRGGADTPESQGESERHLLLEGQYGA